MIRLFTKLCKSLLENFTDVDIFKEATDAFRHYDKKCPRCGALRKLFPYGDGYFRNLVSHQNGETVESRVNPRRFKCASCGATHALLPDILIPYSPYSLRFKLAVLIAYFERNVTVEAICKCFGIAVSTLYSWKKRLIEHKDLLLGMLESQKESAIAFLRRLSEADCLSDHLHNFSHKHTLSFMQGRPQQRHGAAHPNTAPLRHFPPPIPSKWEIAPVFDKLALANKKALSKTEEAKIHGEND
jgi:transposase-like protein